MTFRRIIAWGLIAGLSFSEMQDRQPGFILDCFILRRTYDDQMHGIRRGEDHWQGIAAST